MFGFLKFADGPVTGLELLATYSPSLVLLSYLVASFAAFTALDFAGRARHSSGVASSWAWIAAGALAMGVGIWGMHFVGMLAFRLPIAVTYDLVVTLLSLAVAVVFSGFALFTASRETLTLRRLAVAGSVMGLGVVAMHYIGMAAVRADALIVYEPALFALSVVNAVACSAVALWLVFRIGGQSEIGANPLMKLVAALVMGVAICGMHYIAMSATVCVAPRGVAGALAPLDQSLIELVVGALAVLLLSVGSSISVQNHQIRLRLAQQNRQLMDEIAERRRVEVDLVRARDEADAASRAKSRFLANMSHEIRTPMNGVLGMAELLMKTRLDDRQLRYTKAVRTSGEVLLALLNDILDFSKGEAEKIQLESVEIAVGELISGVALAHEAVATAKGLAFVSALAPDVPRTIHADPVRLRQVLTNFASNAVKFASAGVVRIGVTIERAGVLRFAVTDEGIGIRPEDKARLFQPFVQADSSTTRKFGGTGLGLAICKQLVDLFGGEIGCESLEGVGSTFWFTLPVATPPTTEATTSLQMGNRVRVDA